MMIKIAPLLPASQLRSEDELRSRLWKFREGGLRSYVNANLLCCRDVWVRRSQRPHWKQTQVRRFKKGLCHRGKWLFWRSAYQFGLPCAPSLLLSSLKQSFAILLHSPQSTSALCGFSECEEIVSSEETSLQIGLTQCNAQSRALGKAGD